MEKFSDWRDKGTGIAPFLPPSIAGPNGVSKVIATSWLIVKLSVCMPLLLLGVVTRSKTIAKQFLTCVFGWKMEVSVDGVKRRAVADGMNYPQIGQVFMCNYTSPFDAIALLFISQGPCMFLIPVNNVFYQISIKQFIDYTLQGSLEVEKFGKETSNLQEIAKKYVIFIFPEGTCSNGKTVLPFECQESALQELLDSNSGFRTVQLKINNSLVTPIGVNSKLDYLLRVSNKNIHMKCKINNSPVTPPLDKIRVQLNNSDKYKLVSKNLNIESKRQFIKKFKTYRH